eukprot:2496526-Pleurochrysis_carterae.AAC.2
MSRGHAPFPKSAQHQQRAPSERLCGDRFGERELERAHQVAAQPRHRVTKPHTTQLRTRGGLFFATAALTPTPANPPPKPTLLPPQANQLRRFLASAMPLHLFG